MEILTWKDKIVMKRQAKHHRENLYTGSGLSPFQGFPNNFFPLFPNLAVEATVDSVKRHDHRKYS